MQIKLSNEVAKELKKIRDSIQSNKRELNAYTDMRDDKNKSDNNDTQNALIEVDEDRLQAQADAENALIELDEALEERLADIENALCELTEEE